MSKIDLQLKIQDLQSRYRQEMVYQNQEHAAASGDE